MRRLLSGMAGVIAGLLPIAVCPGCWPAYASVLSSLGIGFVGFGTGHLVTIVVLLSLAVGTLVVDAYRHGRFAPILVGASGAMAVLLPNLTSAPAFVAYGGSGLLFVATVLNAMHNYRRRRFPRCCQSDRAKKSGK